MRSSSQASTASAKRDAPHSYTTDDMVADSAQLQRLLLRHRLNRTGFLERDMPFMWSRCFVSIFSYALLLSDVLRTGMGIHANHYPRVEPNHVMFVGPSAYPVAHIVQNETLDGTHDAWSYKYDTTSIAMRAYAEFFKLQTWPSCLFYRSKCEQTRLQLSTIFEMLDSLVETASAAKSTSKAGPNHLTLRTTNAWIDRIHHFVLPFFFAEHMTRTSQALYYDAKLLRAPGFKFCAQNLVRPYACTDLWTHFTPICDTAKNSLCAGVGRVFEHAMQRIQLLQDTHSDMSVDVLVLESRDDHSKPAVSFQGRQFFDVVVIARVRSCSFTREAHAPERCSTIAVDDYRYEGASLTSNVISWYLVIASIRAVGQIYAWVRLLMLYLGCFYARSAEPRYAGASVLVRSCVAARTMFLIPSQVVIYGSIFPISCYVLAHMLDSAIVYELVAQAFTTPLGVFKLNLREFVQQSAVSMRSVWVLALALHFLLFVKTRRNWSSVNGIPGNPEFSMSFASCLTILAQFRSTTFRDARVESIFEVVPRSHIAAIRAAAYDNTQGVWGLVVLGNTLDAKCLLGAMGMLGLVLFFAWCILRVFGMAELIERIELFFWPTTWVSYAAGVLWPINAFVVSWNGFAVANGRAGPSITTVSAHSKLHPARSPLAGTKQPRKQRSKRVHVSPALFFQDSESNRVIRGETAIPDRRCCGVESMVYLMNLAAMTDPLVLLKLRWFGGNEIGIYESKSTKRLIFLPQAVAKSHHDIPISWKDYDLLLVASTMELPWWDLVQCG